MGKKREEVNSLIKLINYWEEEAEIYKTFDIGDNSTRYGRRKYNERNKYRLKGCPCNGGHWEDITKKNKRRKIYFLNGDFSVMYLARTWIGKGIGIYDDECLEADLKVIKWHKKEMRLNRIHRYRKKIKNYKL